MISPFMKASPFWRRLQCRLVYLLTRHPKFKPIYPPESVSADTLEQAEFLCSSGYHWVSVMLARAIVEQRVRRLSMLAPNYLEYRNRSVGQSAELLVKDGVLTVTSSRLLKRFYRLASQIAHGAAADRVKCLELLRVAAELKERFAAATHESLKRHNRDAA